MESLSNPPSLPVEAPDHKGWKTSFSKRLASKKITEEFEYFATQLDKGQFDGPGAVRYALSHATKRSKPDDFVDDDKKVKELPEGSKVCIVGAGMAGLYIAMILDELKIPNLSYEILEGDNRIGGRVYTHYFTDKETAIKNHDYYDVGAMRFPDIPIMKKTLNLFDHLGPKKVPRIPYYMASPRGDQENRNQPSRYNDRTIIGYKEPDERPKYGTKACRALQDDFHVSRTHGGQIMPEVADLPSHYVSEAFEPFKARLRKNWREGFEALMKFDEFSVRGFMMSHGKTPLNDYYSIQWLETLTDGSGLYDQGFTEGVVDSMDFDYYSTYIHKNAKVDWFCIDGGTQLVADAMNASLKKALTQGDLGKRVTKIAIERSPGAKEDSIKVQVAGEAAPRDYMTVFATPTLACLQRIDLTGLKLLYEQKDAIRSLHYDTATKVGVKFSHPWWIEMGIEGGLGSTDMPIRTCVYPSYNLDDHKSEDSQKNPKPAVLLCSYSWSQDAARMGSLIDNHPAKEVQLKETLFNNLTWLHIEHYKKKYNVKDDSDAFKQLYELISTSYIDHHAFNWHNNEWTSGAYGKFGPGQFSQVFTSLSNPVADSRFHFVGEAVSEHHGWIVGALDSAHQAVLNFLRRFHLAKAEEDLNGLKWAQPPPEGEKAKTSMMKVVLGRLEPEKRQKARAAVEKEKAEGRSVETGAEKGTL